MPTPPRIRSAPKGHLKFSETIGAGQNQLSKVPKRMLSKAINGGGNLTCALSTSAFKKLIKPPFRSKNL